MCQAFANELFLILILPQEKQIGEQGGGGGCVKVWTQDLMYTSQAPSIEFHSHSFCLCCSLGWPWTHHPPSYPSHSEITDEHHPTQDIIIITIISLLLLFYKSQKWDISAYQSIYKLAQACFKKQVSYFFFLISVVNLLPQALHKAKLQQEHCHRHIRVQVPLLHPNAVWS